MRQKPPTTKGFSQRNPCSLAQRADAQKGSGCTLVSAMDQEMGEGSQVQ
jgi:hypothetical protein